MGRLQARWGASARTALYLSQIYLRIVNTVGTQQASGHLSGGSDLPHDLLNATGVRALQKEPPMRATEKEREREREERERVRERERESERE
jgi:hypothetical protein